MKFCCASNAAIKNFKIARKKINFSKVCFQLSRNFPQKYRFLEKNNIHFRILEVLPVTLTAYLLV